MYESSYDAYIEHAFPRDDLKPLTCGGGDSQGGVGLTALDALTTHLVMGDVARLAPAVAWAAGEGQGPTGKKGAAPPPPLSFAVDARVHTFELTIRALGALVSTHTYLVRAPGVVPGYGGGLLAAAVDLADRVAPAFRTPTGLPLSWTNLATGPVDGDTRATCTACAGTLALEFGALAAATGNATYAALARRAALALAARAAPATGLVGNTIDVDTGAWIRRDSVGTREGGGGQRRRGPRPPTPPTHPPCPPLHPCRAWARASTPTSSTCSKRSSTPGTAPSSPPLSLPTPPPCAT